MSCEKSKIKVARYNSWLIEEYERLMLDLAFKFLGPTRRNALSIIRLTRRIKREV